MKRSTKTILGLVLFLAAAYGIRSAHYNSHFLSDTVIGGVHVGGKTTTEAAQMLKGHLADERYTVVENHKKIATFTSRQAGVHTPTQTELSHVMAQQNNWAWPLHLTTATASTHGVDSANVNQARFNNVARQIVATASQTPRTASKNAHLTYRNGQFTVTKPVYGTAVTLTSTKQALMQALEADTQQFQLSNAYVKPSVTAKSASLSRAKANAQKIASHTLTFKLAGKAHPVSTKRVASWLTTKNGQLALKTSAVTKYVSALSKKYGTVSKTRRFKTTNSGTVAVPAGLYGWSIKVAATVKRLKPAVLTTMRTQNVTQTPTIQGTGYHKNGADIGKTYVEVSKAKQHMWIYKNGQLVISTAVVTGKPPKGTTPSGVYVVWSKQRNATLRGLNDDGSKYASKVSYWMPVDNTGVGIHDSPWQPQYGGTWYKSHGSHGCVNTPPAVMKHVFATVALNTPVIIY
ncbi:L,D-transpeptidase family protein [uncultured Secundilactobacillus sp.]|uniref:L,D-transpeptidase family protein n=1 Tax=uncultured Secundilactobacillus sp. TaxID=2813935 RepID=UPI0025931CCA|nr:L,D-transpeptidase family protein [uncultured Secundilactobacillus sp.]